MNRGKLMRLGEVCFSKPSNSKIIKGTLPTENDGTLFPAYSATGQDVFSDGFDFEGDGIVVSAVGARCGKCFLASGKWRAIANTHVILPNSRMANTRFLWYLLNDEAFWIKGGTAQPFVKIGETLMKQIAVPPLADQDQIVRTLDEADALRKLRAQAAGRLSDIIPALFHEMFGDGIAPRDKCAVTTIGDLIDNGTIRDRQDGNHGEIHPKATEYTSQGVPFIFANHISKNNLDLSSCPYLTTERTQKLRVGFAEPNDVLLSHKGSIGFTAVVPPDVKASVLSPQVTYYRFDTKRINPWYAWGYFQSASFQSALERLSQQATRAYVGITRQRELPFLVAPLARQQEFVARVFEVRSVQAEQNRSEQRLEALFQSLLHRAFGVL